VIILIHGPAELIRAETLAELRASVADDETLVDLNTARFLEDLAMILGNSLRQRDDNFATYAAT